MPIPLPPQQTGLLLWAVVLTLTGVSVTVHGLQYRYGGDRFVELVRLFNLSGEGNIPTWFASTMLLAAAVLLGSIAVSKCAVGSRFGRHWWVLAIGFGLMSIDETAQLHEMSTEPMRQRWPTRGVLYNAWVVPAAVLVVALGWMFRGFLRALPAATRRLFLTSAAVYLGGALGGELAPTS